MGMRSYETSRNFFAGMEFCAWCAVVVGAIFTLIGLHGFFSTNNSGFGGPSPSVLFLVPGAILGPVGILGVILCQLGRAQVDTAELTGQILHVARDQLSVSRQSLRQAETLRKGFEALRAQDAEGPGTDFGALAAKPKVRRQSSSLVFGGSLDDGPTATSEAPKVTIFAGCEIEHRDGKYVYSGRSFETLEGAKWYIDPLGEGVPSTLPGVHRDDET